jgi:hypothetical protein
MGSDEKINKIFFSSLLKMRPTCCVGYLFYFPDDSKHKMNYSNTDYLRIPKTYS